MGMDLSRECHHCGAPIGEICKATCSINGDKIIDLIKALETLDISLDEVVIKPRKSVLRG